MLKGRHLRLVETKHWLLRVGLQGKTVSDEARKDATADIRH